MTRVTKEDRRLQFQHMKKMYRIEEREAKRLRTSGLFMKRVVFCMILAALIFTVVVMIVFVRTGQEPSTLIENVFRFLSVEGGALALIKSVKTVKKKEKNNKNEPEQSEEALG